MQDRIFYSICFGFTLGVLLRSLFFINFYFNILLLGLAIALFLFFFIISRNNFVIIVSVLIFTFSLGILRFDASDKTAPRSLESKVEEKITFTGTISNEPDIGEDNQKLTIENSETKFLITANLYDEFEYGDEVKVEGKLQKPENFQTDNGKEFDYINYLRKDGILYVMYYPEIEVVSEGNGNLIKSNLFALKHKFLEKINSVIPNPESLLLGGLILGERAAFPEDMRQKFVDTGTIHIVALSGYNVTIVAEWIMKMFAFLPKNLGFGAGILGILLFVIMSGGASTAVRAGLMAVLVLVARVTGRTYDVARALVLAGVLMILFNPYVLVYDVSFQLSFIATVAVIFFAPKIQKYFLWVPERWGLRDVVATTCAAYIFVLPFILYNMGNLSIVSIPANILILPFIPITMALGFFTSFFSMILHALAVPFGLLTGLLLGYELWIIEIFANFSFASFNVPNFPLWLTLLIYVYFSWKLLGNFFQQPPNLDSQKTLPHISSSLK